MKLYDVLCTPSMHVILYTTLSRRSLARIITVSKCPAQGMTMFPRRRNILLAISKSTTAVFCFPFLPPLPLRLIAFTLPKFATAKYKTHLVRHFLQNVKKRTRVYTCESL